MEKFWFLLLITISTTSGEDNEITTIMKELEIIPDVLIEAPLEFLQATYPQGILVDKGNVITATQSKDAPTLEWNADPNSFYTVLMTTPDAPSREIPIWREWLHWLVVNIPGNIIEEGEVLCPYIGVVAPQNISMQRYIILVFKQTEYIMFDEAPLNNTSIAGHNNFNTMKFVEKYGMGTPVAGNVFQSQWDEYVNILHKQLNVVTENYN